MNKARLKSSIDPLFSANHLTAVRWALAIAVVLGHVSLLTTGFEPLRIHDWTASYMAVNGFFVLSGLLIAKSLHSRRDIKAYALSRLLRIYPALVVVLVTFLFVFAPMFSAENTSSVLEPGSWLYVIRVLIMGDPDSPTAQIFSNNLMTDFNGPLWTIRFELAAYILAGAAFTLGLVNGPWRSLFVFVIVQVVYLSAPVFTDTDLLPQSVMPLLRLSSAFLVGMVLWHWPVLRKPPIWSIFGLLIGFAIFGSGPFGELIATLSLSAIMLRIGLPKHASQRIAKMPDYSYGIYIWHYPILQAVLVALPALSPLVLGAAAAPIILIIASVSWHFIEKPALTLKPTSSKKSAPSESIA